MFKLYSHIGNILPDEMYPINGFINMYDENDKAILFANALIEKDNDVIQCNTTMDKWYEINNKLIPYGSDIRIVSIDIAAKDIPLTYKYQLHAPIDFNGCKDIVIKGKGRIDCGMSFSFNTGDQTNIKFRFTPLYCEDKLVDIEVY